MQICKLADCCSIFKHGESDNRSENSDFLLLRQKDPFGEVISEIYFESSSDLTFLSYFFVKKIPLSRRVGYVMDGSMGE